MAIWLVPVTVTEYGRRARVEADTKVEAIRKARAADWEELLDAERYRVRIAGRTEPEFVGHTKRTP